MDVRSSKKQRGGKFSHYDYRAPSSHVIIFLLQSLLSGSLYLPLCQGNWVDDKHTFISGTIAKFRLKVVDKFNTPLGTSNSLLYSIRIYDEAGNMDLHPQLNAQNEAEPGFVLIEFRTAKAGRHYVFIGNNTFYVPGSPFAYDVFVGQVSIPHCVGRLTPDILKAGSVVILNITLFDPSQNLVKRLSYVEFSVNIRLFDREFTSPTIVKGGETSTGYQAISFYPTLSGKYSMSVGYRREYISNSPFYFTVLPGPFSVAHSTAIGHTDFMNAIAGSPISLTVQQKDVYGNTFSSETKYNFRVTAFQITKGGRSFVMPRVSASYDAKLGLQFLNIILSRAGNSYLEIGSTAENISGSPFPIRIKAGALTISACIGYWVSKTVKAGSLAQFTVIYMDSFGNNVSRATGSEEIISMMANISLSKDSIIGLSNIDMKIVTMSALGVVNIYLNITTAGEYYLHILASSSGKMMALGNSPFFFKVNPDLIMPGACAFYWLNNSSYVAGDQVVAKLFLKDRFNNSVIVTQNELMMLHVTIYRTLTSETMNLIDANILTGIEENAVRLSFLTRQSGNFQLSITDIYGSSISASPYLFSVVPGPVSSSLSTFEGPGLDVSSSGKPTYYVMTLRDDKGAPKGSHLGSLNVEILEFNKMIQIKPNITAVPNSRGVFNVTYLPTISGAYVIMTRWLGVQVGEARYMTVNPGAASAVNCTGMWENNIVNVEAGQLARFIITQRDMYGNGVFSRNSSDAVPFTAQVLKASDRQPIFTSVMSLQLLGDSPTKNQVLIFQIWEEGSHLLQIESEGENIYGSPFPFTCTHGAVALPECSGEWHDGINSFLVGETAKFLIYCTQDVSATNHNFNPLKFQALVMDNSVVPTPDMSIEKMVTESMGSQLLRFSLQKSGTFLMSVQNVVKKRLTGSPFKFTVKQGSISMKHCRGKWMKGINTFEVGTDISLVIRQSDIFGNAVYDPYPFMVKVVESDSKLPVTMSGEFLRPLFKNKTEYILVNVTLKVTGNFSLYIGNASLDIAGSPYLFSCIPGLPAADNTEIVGEGLSSLASINFWNEVIVYIRDVYNNIIPVSNISLSLDVIEVVNIGMEAYNIIPITNTLLSSNVTESTVRIDDFKPHFGGGYRAAYRPDIAGLYYISISLNGSTLETSPSNIAVGEGWIQARFCTATFKPSNIVIAGEITYVYVMARDPQGNSVSYTTQAVNFSVTPLPVGIALPKSVNTEVYNASQGQYFANFSIKTTGTYKVEITAYGSHINGSFYVIEVIPDDVDPLKCTYTISTSDRVLIGTSGVFTIQAKDSFGNNRTSGGEGFAVDLINTKASVIYSGVPFDGDNGKYLFPFRLETDGTYNINITYKGINIFGQKQFVVLKGSTEAVSISHVTPTLLPAKEHTTITLYGENLMQIISFSCNFGDIETRLGSFNTTQETLKCETPYIDVATDVRLAVQLILYQGKSTFNFDLTFYVSNKPIAMKDEVWSWINKFVSFNPLLNDYVSYGSPKLGGVCKGPFYGKAEVVGSSLVYTPQVNFTGIDNLIYTITDFKSQIAYGDVSITVFAYVPQFVSNPRVLIGLEDQPIPSQRGIKGLEIMSPNIDETLQIEVQAKHGHIYFAPDLPQLWQGVQVLSFDNQEESTSNSSKSSLVFTGSLTLVSAAVQALRYLGEPLFNGNDNISIQMFNKKQEGSKTSILVLLQAKNNPPFINISSNILFFNATYWKTHNEIPITSIAVGDPDERDVRGTTKELQLKISIEVSSQSLKISRSPTSLSEDSNAWINPSEAKLRENKRIITGHKIEFQDTIQSCNDALKSLHVIITNPKGLKTVLLTITVNDLGNFGCTEDCTSNSTSPLQDVERILINFEYIPPDVRAKIASGLTCPLVFMLYVTILIIRYRRSLSYDYDDGTLSEEDMLKKTRVFNPMWSKDDVKEDLDDTLAPQNVDFHMENIFEAPVVLQEDSLFDEAGTLDRHNSGEYQYSNESKGSIVGTTARKNIFLIDDS